MVPVPLTNFTILVSTLEENAKTSGGPGPRVRGSVGGESRVSGSVNGGVKICSQTEVQFGCGFQSGFGFGFGQR